MINTHIANQNIFQAYLYPPLLWAVVNISPKTNVALRNKRFAQRQKWFVPLVAGMLRPTLEVQSYRSTLIKK